jgi:hypothetical protein
MARLGTLAFLLCSALFASAQILPGSSGNRIPDLGEVRAGDITITALDTQGAPIADARVEIMTLGTRTTAASGYTDSRGVLHVESVPEGSYEVVVSRGVDSTTDRVHVQGFATNLTLKLATDGDPTVGNRATVSVAQFRVPEKVRKVFRKAQKAFDDRNMEKAQKYLEEALLIEPQYAEALTLRGILKIDARDETGAIDDLSNAIKADAGYPLAYVALGAAFNRANRFDEALQTLERGVALDPMSWQGYFEIGKAQVSKGDYVAGLRSMDKAQSMANDKYPPLHLVKAHALLAIKQYENAMVELRIFLDKAPDAPESATARDMMEKAQAFVAAK